MQTRTVDSLNKTIRDFLQKNRLPYNNLPWEIKQSQLEGLGLFAKRDIEIDEVIFKDYPVILGPRTASTYPQICVNCYKKTNLKPCQRQCGLPVCSTTCQNAPQHQKECKIIRQMHPSPEGAISEKLLKCLGPIRSLLLTEEDKQLIKLLKAHRGAHHGQEVAYLKSLNFSIEEEDESTMRLVCCAMDSNAFEVTVGNEDNQTSLRGLYPLASLANHSCTPNTWHIFNKHQEMVVKASVFIPKNAEIFHSYCRLIWGTLVRRFHLFKTKHFQCKCPRCRDNTEYGSFLSAVLCKKCRGNVIMVDPLKFNSHWQCVDCKEMVSGKAVARTTSLLGSVVRSFEEDDVELMLRFLDEKLRCLVPENSEVIVEFKCKLIWILGYSSGRTWTELSVDLLATKQQYCRDILKLLDILQVGQCKLRGLMLYELYSCLKEENRRQTEITTIINYEMKNILHEASVILMDDVNAPREIKEKCLGNFT